MNQVDFGLCQDGLTNELEQDVLTQAKLKVVNIIQSTLGMKALCRVSYGCIIGLSSSSWIVEHVNFIRSRSWFQQYFADAAKKSDTYIYTVNIIVLKQQTHTWASKFQIRTTQGTDYPADIYL